MKLLGKFLKPYWKELIIGPAFKLSEAVLELLLPLLMARIIDLGVAAGNREYIIRTGILMIVIATVGVCCALVCQNMASRVSQGVGTNLRNAMFQHIGTFSNRELDLFGTASLINRITNDVNQVQTAVAMLIRLVIRAPFLCIGGFIMAMMLDAKLSLIMIIVLPLFTVVLGVTMFRTVPLYRAVQKKLDKLALVIRENLSGVRVIRAFAKMNNEKERFSRTNQEYARTAVRVGRISSLLNPLTMLIMNCSIVAVLWFGGIRVNNGALETGSIIAFINYLAQILAALIVISQLVVLYTKAFASLARINEVFAQESDLKDPAGILEEFRSGSPAVEFRKVSMRYHRGSAYALKDISFSVNPGETVGIIGGTGSGKSTLVNLIQRAYDTTEGQVLLKGTDVRQIKRDLLTEMIGVVPQKTVLFSGTIEENIKWGKENAAFEEVIAAADTAQASEFIERLPDGYQTAISQGGVNVSGGQRQRLTIARALVKKPGILILDDSFNALDYATDRALRTALAGVSDHMTCFIISQRAATIKDADKILVLNDGEAAGIGTHEELYHTCRIYREICQSQLEGEKALDAGVKEADSKRKDMENERDRRTESARNHEFDKNVGKTGSAVLVKENNPAADNSREVHL